MTTRSDRSLFADSRGAMMLMGIPMVLLMIGMLYYAIGIGEQVVLRERMQDAADAAAFSAAVMHARGMNMIALVNQVMAAIVALLVMVRLLQVLMIATAAIGAALSWITAGASLAVVAPATEAAADAEDVYDELKDVVTPILRALHVFELGLKYAMPIAAEARVIDTVRGHYNPPATFGFAIPGAFPLPVIDGKWPELCGKAGEYAGDMIMFPVDAIIGDNIVSDYVGKGIGGLAKSFSALFCDSGSGTDGIEIPDQLPDIPLDKPFNQSHPMMPSVKECQSSKDKDRDQRDADCEQAAIDEARAAPDATTGGPNTSCSYVSPKDQATHTCDACAGGGGQACDEFMFKVGSAASECAPSGGLDAASWSYQRRDFNWRFNLVPVPLVRPEGGELDVPKPEDWPYTIEVVSELPEAHDTFEKEASEPPCGPSGTVAHGYNASSTYHASGDYDSSDMLCVQEHFEPDPEALNREAGPATDGLPLHEWRERFNDPRWTETSEAYEPNRPANVDPRDPWPPAYLRPPYVPAERPIFTGTWSGATFLHSCGTPVDSMDDLDTEKPEEDEKVEQEPADQNSCGQGSELHHTMEPGHKLGDETFQCRAVVFGSSAREEARNVVKKVPLRLASETTGGDGGLHGVLELATKVFVAQAEYYYDTGWDTKHHRYEAEEDQWMWNMSWRARLRRFRLPLDDDDDDDEKSSGSEQNCDFGTPPVDVSEACGDQCGGDGDSMLGGLRDLAESIMVH